MDPTTHWAWPGDPRGKTLQDDASWESLLALRALITYEEGTLCWASLTGHWRRGWLGRMEEQYLDATSRRLHTPQQGLRSVSGLADRKPCRTSELLESPLSINRHGEGSGMGARLDCTEGRVIKGSWLRLSGPVTSYFRPRSQHGESFHIQSRQCLAPEICKCADSSRERIRSKDRK